MMSLLPALATKAQQDVITPELQWVAAQDGVGVEIPEGIVASHDNNVFILNRFESSAKENDMMKNYSLTTDFWSYDMTDGTKTSLKTCTGVPDTESPNGSPNLALYKTTPQGKLLWTVYSNSGDFAGGGVMAATPDDGVVLFLKMRHSSRGAYTPQILCRLVEDDGTETAVEWAVPDRETYGWVYQPVLVKISAAGKVEWAKHIPVEYKVVELEGKKCQLSNNFEARGAVCDEAGNIYLGGSFRTSINFGEKANFTNPRNVDGWDGDSQKVRGDLYVVKLDAEGNALWGSRTAGDPIVCESMTDMTYADGKLYVSGYMKGDSKGTVKMGNSSLKPNGHDNQFIAALSAADGTFFWGNVYNIISNTKSQKPRTKPMHISVAGDDIYTAGSFTGTIVDGTDDAKVLLTCEDKNLNAYVMKSSAIDGAFESGIMISPAISEVQSVHVLKNNVLASGYNLYKSSYLFDLDKNLSAASLKQHVIKDSYFGVTIGSVLIDDMLVSATRGKNSITFPGVDWAITPVEYDGNNNWACIFTGHKLNGMATGITDVEANADKNSQQVIYDLTGRRVNQPAKGLYIINGKKVFIK